MITYHKLDTGEWVAYGPADEIKLGLVEIRKRSGKTCARTIDEVVPVQAGKAIGYLTEHCKPSSQRARNKRLTI